MGKFRIQYKTLGDKNPAKRPEVRKKISLSKTGEKNPAKRPEVRKKIGDAFRGKHLSDEHKKAISEALKGHIGYTSGTHISEDHKKAISEAQKGKHLSEETRRKISETQKGRTYEERYGQERAEEQKRKLSEINKGKRLSEETKRKISQSNRGKIVSEETKRKIGEKSKLKIMSDKTKKILSIINTGKKLSEATKLKMSISRKGEKCHFWKGGIAYEPYAANWNFNLKKVIRERDSDVCQICGKTGKEVHHIDYDKKNCKPDNLIVLCKNCHAKTNSKREYWIELLQVGAKDDGGGQMEKGIIWICRYCNHNFKTREELSSHILNCPKHFVDEFGRSARYG